MSNRGRKVVDLIEEYELTGLGVELERRWTRGDDARMSVRELTRFFNARVVETVLESETGGVSPTRYSSEQIARLLVAMTSDDERFSEVNRAEINEVVAWLESHDVDPEALASDLVSHPVVYAYLTNVRDAEPGSEHRKSTTKPEIRRSVRSQYERFLSRGEKTIEGLNETLENAGIVPETDRTVMIDVSVSCLVCGHIQPYEEFLEHNGCSECDANHSEAFEPDTDDTGE
ncbi:MAG: hypothetical protein PPP58_12325 [Natronomonas sp.]